MNITITLTHDPWYVLDGVPLDVYLLSAYDKETEMIMKVLIHARCGLKGYKTTVEMMERRLLDARPK